VGAPFLAPFARSGPLQGLQSGRPLLEKRGNWEGTIRAESNPTTRAFSESLAFAPFGERYALKGAPYNVDSFTGSPDQLVSDEYDFAAREEHGGQGRWISPDPMRGTGNKYAYADNDPLSKIDLGGLLPDCLGCAEMQAWFDSEMNRPDPLEESESHAPYASQSEGMASGLSAYLGEVDAAFGSNGYLTETPADDQRAQTKDSEDKGKPAQNQANGAGQAHGAGQQGDVATATHYLSRSKEMRLVEKAFKSGHFHLEIIHDGNDRYDPATRTVYWDPHSALETTEGGHQTPALGLGHEMAHATGNRHDTAVLSNTPDARYDTKEERRVILNYENPAARELGESTRSNHGGVPYNVDCPTCQ
jgi:RHS repeat-associated protein